MPIPLTYPGVYVEEIPSGVHTITGVATSITAFVGRALRGPINDPTTIHSNAEYERLFGPLWSKSAMSYAVRDFYLNGGADAVIVRLVKGGQAASLTLPADAAESSALSSDFQELVLEAADAGTWGNELWAIVDHDTRTPDPTLFNLSLQLRTPDGSRLVASEQFLNLSVDPENLRYVVTVLEQTSSLAIVQKDSSGKDHVPAVRPQATAPASPPGLEGEQATGGDDGDDLNDDAFIGPGTAGDKQGLFALEKADLFNLLCIPPYSGEDVSPAVVAQAAKYCEDRRAFYIVDPPTDWKDKATAVAKFTNGGVGTVSNHAAIFFPRLVEPDPLDEGRLASFVPCGAVAGVFSRIDAQRGVWKAPAGQEATLAGVTRLSVPLTDDENGDLNPLGVNCLRSFPLVGPVVWGARTLEGADRLASEWKYVPVRRTALFIEESLYRGTKWVVFEPNDEPLWAQIRLNVGAFMHDLFVQQAFQGKSPREAYFVKCDGESTTQNDIDHGIVNIVVGFAPLKPAEFVVIQIRQIAGQLQV
ncbi:MAG TPA: phage tail sheath subtilisin-like domain-containing protein [Myxococcales bacterium]